MEQLTVGLDDRSYDIIIGTQILETLGEYCRKCGLRGRAAVVTNTVVGPLYYERAARSLETAGFSVEMIETPDGEAYKNINTLHDIYSGLIEKDFNRGSFIVALGGGVTGDMAGFAAATYLRGIPFVQVPTTLLAQVDSSVGGKTGINHELGKNLIGSFYQPGLVLIDVATLDTLPQREYLAGVAEVIKYGVILDEALFEELENNVDKILKRDGGLLEKIIRRCCELKADIVEQDERESGVRAALNYGHTLGHAVEALAGYGTFLHGEAVAIGMVQAARLSAVSGVSTPQCTERITALLRALGLPVELPTFTREDYLGVLLRDKKVRDKGITFVLNKGIGGFALENVPDVRTVLDICGVEN